MNFLRAIITFLYIIALQAVIAVPVSNSDSSDDSSGSDSELSDATIVEGKIPVGPDDIGLGKCDRKAFDENLVKAISEFSKCPFVLKKLKDGEIGDLIEDLHQTSWKAARAICSDKNKLKSEEPESEAYCQCLAKQKSKQLCSHPECTLNQGQAKAARRAGKKLARKARKEAAREQAAGASSAPKK